MSTPPQLPRLPDRSVWYSYVEQAEVLYPNLKKPSHADDSELTDDDMIIRYESGETVGITVLHASQGGEDLNPNFEGRTMDSLRGHRSPGGWIVLLVACLATSCVSIEGQWRRATQLNTKEAYVAFLRAHPGSDYHIKLMEKLEGYAVPQRECSLPGFGQLSSGDTRTRAKILGCRQGYYTVDGFVEWVLDPGTGRLTPNLWGPGAEHTILYPMSEHGYAFLSAPDAPLVYQVDPRGNYVYQRGRGIVVTPGGDLLKLGGGRDSKDSAAGDRAPGPAPSGTLHGKGADQGPDTRGSVSPPQRPGAHTTQIYLGAVLLGGMVTIQAMASGAGVRLDSSKVPDARLKLVDVVASAIREAPEPEDAARIGHELAQLGESAQGGSAGDQARLLAAAGTLQVLLECATQAGERAGQRGVEKAAQMAGPLLESYAKRASTLASRARAALAPPELSVLRRLRQDWLALRDGPLRLPAFDTRRTEIAEITKSLNAIRN